MSEQQTDMQPSIWEDPNIPAGDSPPLPAWPTWVTGLFWALWVIFLAVTAFS